VIPIGYADGIIRKNTGRNVYINEKIYKIVGNICMDMLFIKVDDSVKVRDKVILIKDIEHIKQIATYLDTIPYEVLCSIGKRVPRIYMKE
jgi:alanine racemase